MGVCKGLLRIVASRTLIDDCALQLLARLEPCEVATSLLTDDYVLWLSVRKM